ncbi:MAG: fumarylacetoacetate hydrolase family protein [Burkholderiaceae bacterium]|jgi:2-keto-4-pentenoate hydratase/2-oxohepta-3-ene-1,7-dioic acid hydratase in catechol pathway
MKWLRYAHDGQVGFGVLDGDRVFGYTGELFGDKAPSGLSWDVSAVHLLAPCEPRTVVGLWNNFHALAAKNGWTPPAEPLYFLKAPGSLAGPGSTTPAAADSVGRIAYEGELAIVIGRLTHQVAVEHAAQHIAGYTCANDITAIEVLNRDASFAQWTRAKGLPGFGVFGPVIETEFDLAQATLRTRVGGRERQNYALADMIMPPAELVSRISQDLVLQPGDLILCGTSLGVLPMKPGSDVEVEIDGIGVLKHRYG